MQAKTIFVSIASYRDKTCDKTVRSLSGRVNKTIFPPSKPNPVSPGTIPSLYLFIPKFVGS